MRHRVQRGVRRDGGRFRILAVALDERRRIAFPGVRHETPEYVEQFRHAGAGRGGRETDRHEMSFPQCFLKGFVELLGFDLALLQVQLHEVVVYFDDLVDNLFVGGFRRTKIRVGAVRLEEDIHHLRPVFRRQVDRKALRAECVLDLFQHGTRVGVGRVDLVHHDHPAQALRPCRLHELLRHRFDTGNCIDDDRGGFHRRQYRQCPSLEVGISGGVDEIDVSVPVIEVAEGGAQRVFQFLFTRIEVGDGVSGIHGSPVWNLARRMQQRFVQLGLARASVSNQRNIADSFRGIRHFKPSFVHHPMANINRKTVLAITFSLCVAPNLRQQRRTGQVSVDFAGGLPSLVDRADHEGLPAAAVAGRENALPVRLVHALDRPVVRALVVL